MSRAAFDLQAIFEKRPLGGRQVQAGVIYFQSLLPRWDGDRNGCGRAESIRELRFALNLEHLDQDWGLVRITMDLSGSNKSQPFNRGKPHRAVLTRANGGLRTGTALSNGQPIRHTVRPPGNC